MSGAGTTAAGMQAGPLYQAQVFSVAKAKCILNDVTHIRDNITSFMCANSNGSIPSSSATKKEIFLTVSTTFATASHSTFVKEKRRNKSRYVRSITMLSSGISAITTL
jgi:hypothetical protein